MVQQRRLVKPQTNTPQVIKQNLPYEHFAREASMEIVQTDKETKITIHASEEVITNLARDYKRQSKGKTFFNLFSGNSFLSGNKTGDIKPEFNNLKGEIDL